MSDFKILKCPACGSSNIETQSEKILTCSHCGSNFISKESNHSLIKPNNLSLFKLLFLLAVPLVFTLYIVMSSTPDILKNPKQDSKSIVNPNDQNTNELIKAPISSIPVLDTKAHAAFQENKESIDNKEITQEPFSEPKISIVSKVAGETSIGGKYWIITVKNVSNTPVIRPRVTISLFDKDNRRIAEQTGWSKLETLLENAETTLLVLISEPPTVEFTTQYHAIAALPSKLESSVVSIKVDDFIVNLDGNSNKNSIIIGDVSNPHDFRVDYIRVQAIAKNEQGIAVGLADAFVTRASLIPHEKSGFKVKASTFITEPAVSWSLWASGRKHKE
jgi:DNA-directed RNA polymerase subunit RPC12/RpoP